MNNFTHTPLEMFKAFQTSKEKVPVKTFAASAGIPLDNFRFAGGEVIVYMYDYYIEVSNVTYFLIVNREEYTSSNLEELEQLLYSFILSN